MRLMLASLLAVLFLSIIAPKQEAHAQTPPVVGHGCTTIAYIDADCDGCGVGVISGGVFSAVSSPVLPSTPTGYMAIQNPPGGSGNNAAPFYAVSNNPDADDTDPTVCTTAQWQAKWGSTNAGMVSFLSTKKGFSNSSRIYYVSMTGSNATGAVNDPTHPYFSMAPIMTALSDFQGGAVIVRGATLGGSATVTANNTAVSCTAAPHGTSCTLTAGWAGPTGAGAFTAKTSTGQVLGQVVLTQGSTAISWTPAIVGTPTAALTINYGVLNVLTSPIPANLAAGQRIVMAGLPPNVFILPFSIPAGGLGSYYLASPTTAVTTQASSTAFTANWGMSLDFNVCAFSDGNPCDNLSGSQGHPLYVMAYPGEIVESDIGYDQHIGYPPLKAFCCVTIDGFKWWNFIYDTFPTLASGGIQNAISFNYATNITIINNEFTGWDDAVFIGDYQKDVTVQSNVFHEVYNHAVYYSYGTVGSCGQLPYGELDGNGDLSFAQDAINYANNLSCGAAYRGRILDNVVYDSCENGFDCFHLNHFHDAPVVTGNILAYIGGPPVTIQSGAYNAYISGNLFIDNASNCFLAYFEKNPRTLNPSATHRWNTFNNNVCYSTKPTDTIYGKVAWGGTLGQDNSGESGHKVKDQFVTNNIIVNYDNGVASDTVPMQFELNSNPEGWTITGNTFYSTSSATSVAFLDVSIGSSLASGTYGLSAFQALQPSTFNSNSFANPNFASADPTFAQTPWLFNMAPYNLK